MRLAVQGQGVRFRVHVEDVHAVAGRGVRIVRVGELDPFLLPRHRIDQIALPEELHLLAVRQLHALDQLFQVLRIVALPEGGGFLDVVRRGGGAQVAVAVDGFRDPAQLLPQLQLLLAPDAEARHRHGHRREDGDDRADGDELGDGEARRFASHIELSVIGCRLSVGVPGSLLTTDNSSYRQLFHSTFALPPVTAETTAAPAVVWKAGCSRMRNVSPERPPWTRSASTSPPLTKTSGLPSDEVMRIRPASRLIVATGGAFGSMASALPKSTSFTSSERGS